MRLLSGMLHEIADWLWMFPVPLLLLGVHLWLTCRLRVPQRHIPLGIRESLRREDGSRGGWSVLMVGLAATLGVGNILGMAMAVQSGGAGAVFWCWLSGLLGVATAYAECSLAVTDSRQTLQGHMGGVPVLWERMGHPKRARIAAALILSAGLLMGAAIPGNAIGGLARLGQLPDWVTALFLAALTGMVLLGKGEGVELVCRRLIPWVVALYTVGCCGILWQNRAVLGETVRRIFREAFSFRAVGAGIFSGTAMAALRSGVARGVFSNEAGLGTLGIAAGTQPPRDPARQGMAAAMAAFWDTAVFCALTGVAFASVQTAHPAWSRDFDALGFCMKAFGTLPMGTVLLFVSLLLLGFACIIGWSAVAGQAATFLHDGSHSRRRFALCWTLTAALGVLLPQTALWDGSDLVNVPAILSNVATLWLCRRQIPKIDNIDKINREQKYKICKTDRIIHINRKNSS